MVHADLLRYLADTFDRLQLRYAVTGSTATSVYGETRFRLASARLDVEANSTDENDDLR